MTGRAIPQAPIVVREPNPATKSAAQVLEQQYVAPADFPALFGFRAWSNRHRRVMEDRGLFPKRVYLSERRVVYRRDDILGWMARRDREQGLRRKAGGPSNASPQK
jgi:hypothetical protein